MKEIWEPCPRCGSGAVEKHGTGYFLLLGFVSLCFSCTCIAIPPIAAICFVIGVFAILLSPFAHKKFHCKTCQYSWKYGK